MKKRFALFACLLMLIAACHSGRRAEMMAVLDRADSLNRAFIPITGDSLLRQAADFFDRHGTAAERLRAHYLLGCAYRDLGQAPEALQSFQDAIDRADTLSSDSMHNALLCRVYSQMANVYYYQNLTVEQLECIERSIHYSLACSDTTTAIKNYFFKIGAFLKHEQHDSVIAVFEHAKAISEQYDCRWIAAQNSITALQSFLSLGCYDMAAECISLYELQSGYVDSSGNVSKGREIFYCLKGLYYLAVNKLDSAETMFRRTLKEGKDFNCQNGAAHGLAELYSKTNMADSALKYAMYSYDMNDSVYARMAIEEVGQVKALYDYSVYQRETREANSRAYREREKVVLLCFLLLLALGLLSLLINRFRYHRKAAIAAYNKLAEKLNVAQSKILRFRSHEDELNRFIKAKDDELEKLKGKFLSLKKNNQKKREPLQSIEDFSFYSLLQSKAIKGQSLTDEEWLELNNLVIKCMPSLYMFLSDRNKDLKLQEYRLCVLLRLGVKPIDISHMFDIDPSYVTRLGKSALHKLYGCEGKIKDLVEKIKLFD